ncbi:hypothetical protein D3C85_566110 [compost metagenome]
MADGEVAVGDPDAVAPGDIRRLRIDIGIRRAHVGDRREDHRVEPQPIHPLLKIDTPGLFQPAQAIGQRGDLIPRGDATLGHAHVFVHANGRAIFAVRQSAWVVRENLRAVDVSQTVQSGIVIGLQEIIERPGGQVPQFML